MVMPRFTRIAILVFCTSFAALAFINVEGFIDASRQGFSLFTQSVLPVLFPFFFITSLAIHGGASKPWQVYAFSLLGGFPTSARMISELHERGQLSRRQSIRLCIATSFPSPIFIVATVGISLFASIQIGLIALAAITIGAAINGFLYKPTNGRPQVAPTKPTVGALPQQSPLSAALQSAIQGIMMVGGLIVIFYIIGAQIDSLFNLPPALDVTTSSLLEMTAGVFRLSSLNMTPFVQTITVTAILAFSGLCIGLQGMLFFKKFGMSLRFYFLYKTTHALLAILVAICLAGFINWM